MLAGCLVLFQQMRLRCMRVLTPEFATLAVVTRQVIDLVKTEATEVDLTAESVLRDAGLDSLKFMSIVFKIEAYYDIELEEEDPDDLRTVADLATLVVARIRERS